MEKVRSIKINKSTGMLKEAQEKKKRCIGENENYKERKVGESWKK